MAQTSGQPFENAIWKIHSTSAFQTIRLFDTPDKAFMLQHSHYYSKTRPELCFAGGNLFYVDKTEAEPKLRPATEKWNLSNNNIETAEFLPATRQIAVAYDNNIIDIIDIDGNVASVEYLSTTLLPSKNNINGFSYSAPDNKIFVATSNGFITIDATTREVVDKVRLDKNVSDIIRSGSNFIAIIDNALYMAPASAIPSSPDDFKAMTLEAPSSTWHTATEEVVTPRHIKSLASGGFMFMGKGANATTGWALCAAFPDASGTWHAREVMRDVFTLPAGYVRLDTESCVTETRNGYAVNSTSKLYLLDKTAVPAFVNSSTPTADEVTTQMQQYARTSLVSNAKPSNGIICSTWDGSTVWHTYDYLGISTFALNGGEPQPKINDLYAEVPAYSLCDNIEYSPEYGTLFMPQGMSWNLTANGIPNPATLYGRKNGKWVAYSPHFNNAAFTKDIANWNVLKSAYPVTMPNGLTIDPANPAHIYTGSTRSGIARFDLANPDQPLLHLAQPANTVRNVPGFIAFAPNLKSWSALCRFSAVTFDTDQTAWSCYYNNDAAGGQQAEAWYWTKEDRLASAGANLDASTFREWKKFTITGQAASNTAKMLALRHSDNKNLLVYLPNNYDSPIVIIDHKGTLDDTSDDEIFSISRLYDSNSDFVDKTRLYEVMEDPDNGNVWIGTFSGCFSFYPRDFIKNNIVNVPEVNKSPYYYESGRIFESVQVQSIKKDNTGRLWFGTFNSGIYCLSPNGKELLAHYTTENSELPSDCVNAICYDPEENSIFCSTRGGIAQLLLSGYSQHSPSASKVKVTPASPSPDYHGWISIAGVPDNVDIFLCDSKGNIARNLGKARGGSLQFRIDSNGQRLSTDIYTLRRADSSSTLSSIRIMR